MARKNMQDRYEIVWDELLDGDYGGLDTKGSKTVSLVGRAFKFSANGVRVADDTDFAGIFVRDNGQGGILPESMEASQDLSGRYKDGDEVSILLKGQCTYAIAGEAIVAGNHLIPGAEGKWFVDDAFTAPAALANVDDQVNNVRTRGVHAMAKSSKPNADGRVVFVFY